MSKTNKINIKLNTTQVYDFIKEFLNLPEKWLYETINNKLKINCISKTEDKYKLQYKIYLNLKQREELGIYDKYK